MCGGKRIAGMPLMQMYGVESENMLLVRYDTEKQLQDALGQAILCAPSSLFGTLPSPLRALFNALCSALTPFYYCTFLRFDHLIG